VSRQQDHLVTQHLENISRKALEQYEEIIRKYVRRRQGIYALYRNGKLYYVGLASNLRRRLARHLRDRHSETWDRFSIYLTIGDRHLKELESLVLRISPPKGNLTKGKFARSIDLRRQFNKDITRYQKTERESIFGRVLKQIRAKGSSQTRSGLAKYVTSSFKIRFTYKGKAYYGRVRSDGRIRYKGKLFRSPSAAAVEVRRKPTDGWFAWHYERAPGDWVPLDELRR
jgi:hypothetical protein